MIIDLTTLGTAGFTILGDSLNDSLGVSIANAGDVNGDGFDDLIIGASGNSSGGTNAGAAYLIFGKASGFGTIDLAALTLTQGIKIQGDSSSDIAGQWVAGAGDVNHDGYADVIVGAPQDNSSAGAAYILFGKSSGFANLDLTSLDPANGFGIFGGATADRLGRTAAGIGNVNGDGIDNVIVSAYGADVGAPDDNIGKAYVVYGKAAGLADLNVAAMTAADGFVITGNSPGGIARTVAALGDVNHDGYADFAIGALTNAGPPFSIPGSVFVILGKAGGVGPLSLASLTAADEFEIQGVTNGDTLGVAISAAGDVNGDGIDDFVIGASGQDSGGAQAGMSYVVFGKASGLGSINLASLAPGDGFTIQGDNAGDASGYSVSTAGDFNGDGFADIIVGAASNGSGGTQAGAAYLIYGKASGFAAIDLTSLADADGFKIQGDNAGDLAGISVSGGGDINHDELDDLLVGANWNDPVGRSQAGAAYVIFGVSPFAAPVVTTTAGTTGFVQGGVAVAVDSGITVTDSDSATFASAKVSISGNHHMGEDLLAFVNSDPATYGNIAASFDSVTGTLTLSSAGSTATVAQFQAALRAVTYTDGYGVPNTDGRTITFVVNDGHRVSIPADHSVSVTSTNDAPVPIGGGTNLAAVDEDTANPAGATVSSLFASHFSDPDGSSMLAGIAVTGFSSPLSGQGSWQFSSNGTTWTSLDAASEADAIILAPTSLVRFLPAANFAGAPPSLLAHLMESGGTPYATGAIVDLTALGTGGNTAFSAAEVPLATTINPQPDVATITGTATGSVIEQDSPTVTDYLVVIDPDAGEDQLVPIAAGTPGTNGYGTFEVLADGTWTYTLDNNDPAVIALSPGGTLADTITVTSFDGTDTQVITVTIYGSAANAVIGGTTTGSVTEDASTPNLTTSGALTITDPDAGESSFQSQSFALGDPVGGQFTLATNGNWTYKISNSTSSVQRLGDGETRTDSFVAVSKDGLSSQTITVTIHGVNDQPLADFDTAETDEDTPVAIYVLDNDSDRDSHDVLAITAANVSVGGGSVSIAADQASITFNPVGSYDYLAVGETAMATISYSISDGHGGTSSSSVEVTITGLNEAPVISIGAGDSASLPLIETNAGLSGAGTLTVTDQDLTDTVTLSIAAFAKGGTTAGIVPNDAALQAMFTANTGSSLPADPGNTHNIGWNFSSGGEAFNYLDDGEVLTLTYTIRATDSFGDHDDQDVIVTITGTNDAPTIGLVSPNDSSFFGITDGDVPLLINGTLTVFDPDLSDSVTAQVVSLLSTPAFVSGFGLMKVPTGSIAADPLGNPANLSWQFGANANVFDYLAAGEHQNLSYGIRVVDDSGAFADQSVLITVFGINEAPIIAGSLPPSTAVVEIEDGLAGENATLHAASGILAFTDTDVSDTHSAIVAANGSGYLGSFDLSSVDQGANNVGWTFTIADSLLNSLGAGVTLHQDYTVTISDGHGGTASRVIGVDLIGTNDAAILSSANVVVTQGLIPVLAQGQLTITDEDNPATFVPESGVHGNYGTLGLAANGVWSYIADAAFTNLAPGQSLTDTFTVHALDGTPTTITVSIAGSDDVAIARSDMFETDKAHAIGAGLSLFADNGFGADSDPDSPLTVGAVNGDPAYVGHQIQLASGALLTVNANGTFSYNPNHAFDNLTAAPGAPDQHGNDSFTYTLIGGSQATANIRINGLGAEPAITGNGGDNVLNGTPGPDFFRLEQGGDDSANGLGSNDGFYFGANFDGSDNVDGGAGTDTIALQGNTNAVLGDITNVEVIALLSGSNAAYGDNANNRYDYDLTTNNSNVGAGQTLTVIGTALLPGEDLHFDGSAETDGNFRIFAGQGVDDLTGGSGNDGFFFGADHNLTGADHVDGGAGTDSIALRGNYVGANAVVFQDGSFANVEVLALLSGHSNEYGGVIVPGGYDYDVTMANGNVAAGQILDVSATKLGSDESLRFDGRAETDGAFRILSGAGSDTLYGGSQNDMLYGGMGKDWMEGGAGADTYVFRSASESTGIGYDTISGFDYHADRIDAPGGGSRGFSHSTSGNLSLGSFDADLASGMSGVLGAGQAALFTASGGSLSGHVFAVIDVNGVAGYQSGEDLVIELLNPVMPIDPLAGVIV